jgi:hypothetical protein
MLERTRLGGVYTYNLGIVSCEAFFQLVDEMLCDALQ